MEVSRTVEERIVCQPDTAGEDNDASDSAQGALGWSAATCAKSLAPSGELGLDTLPGFLGVGGRHVGSVVVEDRMGWRRWRCRDWW